MQDIGIADMGSTQYDIISPTLCDTQSHLPTLG